MLSNTRTRKKKLIKYLELHLYNILKYFCKEQVYPVLGNYLIKTYTVIVGMAFSIIHISSLSGHIFKKIFRFKIFSFNTCFAFVLFYTNYFNCGVDERGSCLNSSIKIKFHLWQTNQTKYKCRMNQTPWYIPRPVVDGDVVDAEDTGQVYPPGGSLFVILRNNTLPSPY